MQVLKSIMLAASGMRAQSSRMRIIVQNLANANTTAETAEQDPYRRQVPTFKNEVDRELGIPLVSMDKTLPDKAPFGKRFDPGHPAADELGYVKLPNVNGLVEVMDMREAQRSFEANLQVVQSARAMLNGTLELLRRS